MGGIGSGRHKYTCNLSTDELPALNISMWSGHELRGAISNHQVNWKIQDTLVANVFVRTGRGEFTVRYSREGSIKTRSIQLSWTKCNYGGVRAWFLCPEAQCQKRVKKLYLGTILACRYCLNLRYASKGETIQELAIRRVRKTRRQLYSPLDLFKQINRRPSGMRTETFKKLLDSHSKQMRILTLNLRDNSNRIRQGHYLLDHESFRHFDL